MTETVKVLYPPGMQWEIMAQRPHHLLEQAAAAGWRVTWCEPGLYRKPGEIKPNLWLAGDLQAMASFAPYDLLYVTDPLQLKYVHPSIRPPLLIYDRCDPRGDRERSLIRQADLVLATTPELLEEPRRYARRSMLLPNAADAEHFMAGEKRQAGTPPVMGYMGVLAGHLDYPLLSALIEQRPGYSWFFAGEEKFAGLPAAPNVCRFGHLSYAALPGFLSRLDVALVPFLDTPHTRIVESVKLYEYLAAAKQVVATRLPSLERGDWPIRLAAGQAQWLGALDGALMEGPYNGPARAWSREHTWRRRFERFAAAISLLMNQVS